MLPKSGQIRVEKGVLYVAVRQGENQEDMKLLSTGHRRNMHN